MVHRSAWFVRSGRSSAAALGIGPGDWVTVVWSDGQIAKGQVCAFCSGMTTSLERAHSRQSFDCPVCRGKRQRSCVLASIGCTGLATGMHCTKLSVGIQARACWCPLSKNPGLPFRGLACRRPGLPFRCHKFDRYESNVFNQMLIIITSRFQPGFAFVAISSITIN